MNPVVTSGTTLSLEKILRELRLMKSQDRFYAGLLLVVLYLLGMLALVEILVR